MDWGTLVETVHEWRKAGDAILLVFLAPILLLAIIGGAIYDKVVKKEKKD